MTTTKTFDALESKRVGADLISNKLKGMTLEEQLAYWQNGDRELRERQAALRRERGSGGTAAR